MSYEERDVKTAMLSGWRKTCPRCGRDHLFHGYLRPIKTCRSCGLDLTPQRADDGPAYLTIVIVGHVLVPIMPTVYHHWSPEPWMVATGFSILAIAMTFFLLPRVKGALIGFQWAKRLHGFCYAMPSQFGD